MKTKEIIICISVFLLSAIYVNAQQKNVSKSDTMNSYFIKGANYIDKNKDGICDNRQSLKTTHPKKGQNYIDKNKDGVCDNKQNKNNSYCCGRGNGRGKGQGNGCQHRYGWRNGNH